MTNKIPKWTNQLFLGILVLAFAATACNNKKEGEKKETPADTTTVKPVNQQPADTMTKMNAPADTAKKKPVKDPS